MTRGGGVEVAELTPVSEGTWLRSGRGFAVTTSGHVAAPPGEVFGYFTDPARYVRWMGAEASLAPVPGGEYRIRMGDGFGAAGQFTELDPPRRLVFTRGFRGRRSRQEDQESPAGPRGLGQRHAGRTRVTVTFTPEGPGTRLGLTAIIALFSDDAWLTMPPFPLEYQGRELTGSFLAAVALRDGRTYQLTHTRANRQLAFGAVLTKPQPTGHDANGLIVPTVTDGQIAAMTRFPASALPRLSLAQLPHDHDGRPAHSQQPRRPAPRRYSQPRPRQQHEAKPKRHPPCTGPSSKPRPVPPPVRRCPCGVRKFQSCLVSAMQNCGSCPTKSRRIPPAVLTGCGPADHQVGEGRAAVGGVDAELPPGRS
jgi:uncharacterized protein YndB with AHSA1/START domain